MSNIFGLIAAHRSTILLYAAVIASASFCAYMSYRRDAKTGERIYRKHWLFASFAILLIFIGFADCGKDYAAYKEIFLSSHQADPEDFVVREVGYRLLNAVILFFSDSFELFHFIWALLMLSLIYLTVAKYREILHPGMVITAYTCMFCIQSMNLMRIYLASAVIFFGIRYIIEKKTLKYYLVILAAALIHTSALCILLPYTAWLVFGKRELYALKAALFAAIFAAVILFRDALFGQGIFSYTYKPFEEPKLGLAAFVYILPVFLVFVYYRYVRRQFANDRIFGIVAVFSMALFGFSILAYFVEVFGRFCILFTYPYMVFPAYIVSARSGRDKSGSLQNKKTDLEKLIPVFFICYFVLRAVMSIEYIETDGLGSYSMIFFK